MKKFFGFIIFVLSICLAGCLGDDNLTLKKAITNLIKSIDEDFVHTTIIPENFIVVDGSQNYK